MSEAVATHQPCPDCGSSDALTVYDDGHSCCFSCEKITQNFGGKTVEQKSQKRIYSATGITDRSLGSLKARRLTEETCRKYGYYKAFYKGSPVQLAAFTSDTGEEIGAKIRTKNKDFLILGSVTDRFFGQHLFSGGRKLIITEGEIDCLTVSQVTGNKYPVVSIPNGTNSAKKCFQKNLEWLNTFQEVIIMFDNDEPGRAAVKSVQGILAPGKMKIATLPLKDPNELLLANRPKEIIDSIYNAKTYTPEGIIDAKDLWDDINKSDLIVSYPYPFTQIALNKATLGIRKGEMTLITAGTGIGKSTFSRYLAHDLALNHHCKIGMAMLEEQPKRTLMGLMSVHAKTRLHTKWDEIPEDYKKAVFDEVFKTDRFSLYNHFGSLEGEKLLEKLRYLAVAKECDFIFLDHVSIAVSGLETNKSERQTIDILMTKLASLVQETGVGIIVVSHLRKTDSKSTSHEQGGIITLDDLRGSGSLKQLPDTILALERNQQSENELEQQLVRLRLLKNRFNGRTGIVGHLGYDSDTEQYIEVLKVSEYTGECINDSKGEEPQDYGF